MAHPWMCLYLAICQVVMKYCFQLQSQESGCISLSGNLHLSYGFLTSPLSAVRGKCKVRTLLKKAANPQRRKYHEKFIQVSDWEQQYYNHRWHHHSFEQNKIISPGVDMVRQNGWYRCSCVTKRKISYLLCHNSRS